MVIATLLIDRWPEDYFCNKPKESSAKKRSLLRVAGDLDLEII